MGQSPLRPGLSLQPFLQGLGLGLGCLSTHKQARWEEFGTVFHLASWPLTALAAGAVLQELSEQKEI